MIAIPGTIAKVETRSDMTLKITVNSQEVSDELAGELMKYRQKLGYFAFAETGIREEDIPDEPIDVDNDKSPSQRLRGRMFAYYREKFKTTNGFNAWYVDKLEEYGNKYLEKLN